jgi:hypothetical protein
MRKELLVLLITTTVISVGLIGYVNTNNAPSSTQNQPSTTPITTPPKSTGGGGGGGHHQSQIIRPTVVSEPCDDVYETEAYLFGTLTNDGGEFCSAGIEYGLTTHYGTKITPSSFNYVFGISNDDTYIYGGGFCSIWQCWKSNLTKKASLTRESPFYLTLIMTDSNYIYGLKINGTSGAYYGLVQYWKSNMTKKIEIGLYPGYAPAFAQDTTYFYASFNDVLQQYWKSNMTKKTEIVASTNNGNYIAVDNEYIYFVNFSYNMTICQHWTSNMTKKTEIGGFGGANASELWVTALAVDDTYIYLGGNIDVPTSSCVYQYWKNNMTKKAETAYHDVTENGEISIIIIDSEYIYAADSKKIYQYWKNNLTEKAEVATLVHSISQDDTYIYVGGNENTFYQYRKSTLTEKAEKISYVTGEMFGTGWITGLSPGTTYHYRAYAKNSAGEGYGNDKTFTTLPPWNLSMSWNTTDVFDHSATVDINGDVPTTVAITNTFIITNNGDYDTNDILINIGLDGELENKYTKIYIEGYGFNHTLYEARVYTDDGVIDYLPAHSSIEINLTFELLQNSKGLFTDGETYDCQVNIQNLFVPIDFGMVSFIVLT